MRWGKFPQLPNEALVGRATRKIGLHVSHGTGKRSRQDQNQPALRALHLGNSNTNEENPWRQQALSTERQSQKIGGGRNKSGTRRAPLAEKRNLELNNHAVEPRTDGRTAARNKIQRGSKGICSKAEHQRALLARKKIRQRNQDAGAPTGQNQRAEETEIRPERHEWKSQDLLHIEPAHEDMN
jgi:hypothetical protein